MPQTDTSASSHGIPAPSQSPAIPSPELVQPLSCSTQTAPSSSSSQPLSMLPPPAHTRADTNTKKRTRKRARSGSPAAPKRPRPRPSPSTPACCDGVLDCLDPTVVCCTDEDCSEVEGDGDGDGDKKEGQERAVGATVDEVRAVCCPATTDRAGDDDEVASSNPTFPHSRSKTSDPGGGLAVGHHLHLQQASTKGKGKEGRDGVEVDGKPPADQADDCVECLRALSEDCASPCCELEDAIPCDIPGCAGLEWDDEAVDELVSGCIARVECVCLGGIHTE